MIDEVQRVPELPSYLQGIVDADGRPGRWVLTGSQNLLLMEHVTQSLAGRTGLLTPFPFSLAEQPESPERSTTHCGRAATRAYMPTVLIRFYITARITNLLLSAICGRC